MKKQAYNPFLPGWEHIPDGEPYVFGDRLYLYGSHDRYDGGTYCMNDYVCWSAPVDDLGNWIYEGVIFRKASDPTCRKEGQCLYAPDVQRGADGRFYLYYFYGFSGVISVAVCDTPAGQYQYYGSIQLPNGHIIGKKRGDLFKGCRRIHERTEKAKNKQEFGHWELDSLVFSRKEEKTMAVFVERQKGYIICVLLGDKKAETMKKAIIDTFSKLPKEARKTLTVDRGREFEFWREIEAALHGTKVYFCDPNCPQQKGCVENANGLLRQYYPKNKGTLAPSPDELAIVQESLNNRPRKRLGFLPPCQLFSDELNFCCT